MVDELEFEENAQPTIVEDRVTYRASVAGFPVNVAAMNTALAKLWPANRGPTNLLLLDRFDPLHANAQRLIKEKYMRLGLDENDSVVLTAEDVDPS